MTASWMQNGNFLSTKSYYCYTADSSTAALNYSQYKYR